MSYMHVVTIPMANGKCLFIRIDMQTHGIIQNAFCVEHSHEYIICDHAWLNSAVGLPAKRHITHLKKAQWDCKMSIQQISCGYHHSMILTTEGKVFACGANVAGALGRCCFHSNVIYHHDESILMFKLC